MTASASDCLTIIMLDDNCRYEAVLKYLCFGWRYCSVRLALQHTWTEKLKTLLWKSKLETPWISAWILCWAQQMKGNRGSTVVKVLCYKSECRCFDPSWCQWISHWHNILPIALWPWGRLSLKQKWVPGVFPGGKGGRCVRLTTFHHPVPLSWSLGTLTSWNPLGSSGPVTGLLYF